MSAARSRVAVIFFIVLIDLIGFGIIIPILPYYAQRLGAEPRASVPAEPEARVKAAQRDDGVILPALRQHARG